jgi:hypothetical protein
VCQNMHDVGHAIVTPVDADPKELQNPVDAMSR